MRREAEREAEKEKEAEREEREKAQRATSERRQADKEQSADRARLQHIVREVQVRLSLYVFHSFLFLLLVVCFIVLLAWFPDLFLLFTLPT
jgi:hypothetical protein